METNQNIIKYEVQNIISSLEEEKNKILTEQSIVSFIDFETYKPTEKQWHQLMEIDNIRTNKILTSCLIKNIFPKATDIRLGANYIYFKLNEIDCMISISRMNEVYIAGKYKKDYNSFENIDNEKLDKFLKAIKELSLFHKGDINFYNTEGERENKIISYSKIKSKLSSEVNFPDYNKDESEIER